MNHIRVWFSLSRLPPCLVLCSHTGTETHFSLCERALWMITRVGARLALIHIISRSSLFNHCWQDFLWSPCFSLSLFSLFSRLLTAMPSLLAMPLLKLPPRTSTSSFCLTYTTFRPLCHFSEMPLFFQRKRLASCVKGSEHKLSGNWVASAISSPVRQLWHIVAVLAESTAQIGDDTGHSTWLYSALWCSLSKHAQSAVPAPKHKRGPCFVVVAQSRAFWSTPVMLLWRQDSSFSLRHCRVRQGSSIGQIHTAKAPPPSPTPTSASRVPVKMESW